MINKEKMDEYVNLGIFLIAMVFIVVSIISLYSAANSLISIWLNYKYIPLFQILFNLAILIVCIYLIREKVIKKK